MPTDPHDDLNAAIIRRYARTLDLPEETPEQQQERVYQGNQQLKRAWEQRRARLEESRARESLLWRPHYPERRTLANFQPPTTSPDAQLPLPLEAAPQGDKG